MAIKDARAYLETRFKALGYRQHDDIFDRDNIGETVLNKTFVVRPENVSGGPVSHTHQSVEVGVLVSVFFKGYRDIFEAFDATEKSIQNIIVECCKAENRLGNGSTILNCVFESADLGPISDSNGNSVLVEMRFTLQTLIGVDE